MLENDDLRRPPISYPVAELPAETGVSRSLIYEEIRRGNLETFKVKGRRYATHQAVIDWIHRLTLQTRKASAA